MKARFTDRQLPVNVVRSERMSYIFLCLNEKEKTEIYPDMGEGKTQETYYEYDYNEIYGPTDKLPVKDIQEHPENYLEYEYISEENMDAKTYTDRKFEALRDRTLPVQEEIVMMEGD